MTANTEETFDKISKKEIIGIILSLQNKVEAFSNASTDALEEIRKFNENFVKLESEISIVKKVNTLFHNGVFDMERQCWENTQYSNQACHRLTNSNDRIRGKFSQRKHCDQVMSVKRDLRKFKLEDVGLRGSNPIFINQSLCPKKKVYTI